MSEANCRPARAALRLIGRFRLTGGDGAAIEIPSRRARGLLAYLALNPDRSASRERLCGLLWSDRGESQARASLRQCLVELRTVLQPRLDVLDVGRQMVNLRAELVDVDVDRLQTALSDKPETLATALNGVTTYHLLDDLEIGGLFEEWRDQARERLDRAIAGAVESRLEALAVHSDWPNIRALAEAYLQRDRFDETVVAAAIRADMAMGATGSAHRRFQALEADLAKELGVAPGPTVRAALTAPAKSASEPAAIAPPSPPAAPAETAAPVGDLLAVLAFDNISGDPEIGSFSDGMSEEILQAVASISELKVIGRSSSFQLRGADKATSNVAAMLKATHVLDGSVRRNGARVRISASLVACANQTLIWSERFDRDLADVFALQDEIASAVATALKLVFTAGGARRKVDPEAYEVYLRARSLMSVLPEVEKCIELLTMAVRLSPDLAPAWSSLALARALQARSLAPKETFAVSRVNVREAAQRALALDKASGLAYAALSLLEAHAAYETREELLLKARVLEPSNSEALRQMSFFLYSVGRVRESLVVVQEAERLDPLSPGAALSHAERMGDVGQLDAYYDMLAHARPRWPDFIWLMNAPLLTALNLKDHARVDGLLAEAKARGLEFAPHITGAIRMFKAPADVARVMVVTELQRQLETTGLVQLGLTCAASNLGALEEVFKILDQASFAHLFSDLGGNADDRFLPGLIFGIINRVMRADPRFVDLCHKLGLCRYWVVTERWPDCVEEVADVYDFKARARALVAAA